MAKLEVWFVARLQAGLQAAAALEACFDGFCGIGVGLGLKRGLKLVACSPWPGAWLEAFGLKCVSYGLTTDLWLESGGVS